MKRSYLSGSQKRKIAEEKTRKLETYPKLTSFFQPHRESQQAEASASSDGTPLPPATELGKRDMIISKDGFGIWKNIHSYLKDHEHSAAHEQCKQDWHTVRTGISAKRTVDSANLQQIELEKTYWNSFLTRIIDIICHLAQHNLALRGNLVLHATSKKEDVTTAEAKSLVDEISSGQFTLCIVVWYDVLYHINLASKLFQSPSIGMDFLRKEIEAALEFLQEYRDAGFESAHSIAKDFTKEMKAAYDDQRFEDCCKHFAEEMGDNDPNDLKLEISSSMRSMPDDVSDSALNMLNYIYNANLLDQYPNLSVAFRILLSVPVTDIWNNGFLEIILTFNGQVDLDPYVALFDATCVPDKAGDTTVTAIVENGTESSSDLFNVTVQLPGGDDLEVQVSPKELVQEIIQVLMEQENSCHRTCFSLQFEGNVLDNFSELKSVAGLKEGSVLKVVEEPYTIREARIHIRHFRDLLKSLDLTDAYNGVDCNSLSFLNSISEGDIGDSSSHDNNGKKKKRPSTEQAYDAIDCSPPEYILPGSTERPFQPLQPLTSDSKSPQCLKSVMLSGWNPPPGNRKMHGDLMYLTVVTMEDNPIHITSSNRGFYVNQSTADVFNPKPSSPSHLCHSIVELLNQVSPAFKKNFAALQKKRAHCHPLERIPTPYQVYSWIAPNTNHTVDCVRAEDAYNSRLGYEEHIPGQTRDWNEELQTTRELHREFPADQQLRQRANFKINSDFVGASTRGAMAVIDGNVMAINPGEETKMQMFIWNNIFFSFGFDVRDHYKDLGGDHAASAAASHDLKGVQAYSDLDIEELYVLGTVVLDYRGYRVTAQSIIPGILDRKEDQSVVYGSIDFGKTVTTNTKYLTLLYKACKPLRILRHTVLDDKNEEVVLCSSVECKGIVGNDGRHYILDLLRTFPPDVNFLPLKEEDMCACRDFGFPKTYRHRLCSLRPELLEVFVQFKYGQFMKIIMERSQNGNLLHPEKNEDGSPKDELKGADIVQEACREIGSVSEFIFDIRFNPDVYSPVVRFPESKNKVIQIQKRLLSDAATFLIAVQIPSFIKACLNHIIIPLDGKTLTEAVHLHGINMRYLGSIAEMIDKVEARSALDHLYRLVIVEIVTRSAKAILRRYLQGVEMSALSAALSHFLNCFLSSYPNPVAHLPPDELISRKRKNKRKIRPLENGDSTAWASMTPSHLWKQIQQNAKDSFDFTFSCDSVEQLVERFSLQKVTLLREICIKTGVQVLLRDYNFDSRHKPAFTEEDILNMFPVVKHIIIKAKEANQLFSKAQVSIQQGALKDAVVLLNEALIQFSSVYGAVHPEIALCLRLLARIKFLLGDIAEAVENQQKAVIMTERTLGYDSANAIQDYVLLSHYYFASGQLPVALKLLYRARYLMLFLIGEDHPTMATLDSNIGVVLQAVLESNLSLRFLEKALEANQKYYGMKSLDVALSHHLIALAYTSKAEFRVAMQHEKETYIIYKTLLGDCHERTRESSAYLKHVTQQAVNLQRTMNEIYKSGSIATLPHVQIIPPGIETLLEQLNLLNGILRISPSVQELNDNNHIQNEKQNSIDRTEEQIQQMLGSIAGGQPKDADDKKDGGENSKGSDDKKDGDGEQSKDAGKKEDGGGEQSKDSDDKKDDSGEQAKDGDDKKDSGGDQSRDRDDKKDGSGDQSRDGDDKKDGDDEQSKDDDDKKDDDEQTKDGNDEKDDEEQSKDSDNKKEGENEQSADGEQKEGDGEQSADGEQKGDSEQSADGEQKGDSEQSADGEQKGDSEQSADGEQKGDREQSADGEQKGDSEQSADGEQKGDSEQSADGEQKGESEQSADGEQKGDNEQSIGGEQKEGGNEQSADVEQKGDNEQSTGGEQKGDNEQSTGSEQKGDNEQSTGGEQKGDNQQSTGSEQKEGEQPTDGVEVKEEAEEQTKEDIQEGGEEQPKVDSEKEEVGETKAEDAGEAKEGSEEQPKDDDKEKIDDKQATNEKEIGKEQTTNEEQKNDVEQSEDVDKTQEGSEEQSKEQEGKTDDEQQAVEVGAEEQTKSEEVAEDQAKVTEETDVAVEEERDTQDGAAEQSTGTKEEDVPSNEQPSTEDEVQQDNKEE
ncbi:clustered mitochondria protein homolog [Hyperolius riggenbachi]|uniref:clustered mitochondria protein homolog n=1 Tax=Hyperolius riggenbachi TaxID=752182 RepID=UPI0035A35962